MKSLLALSALVVAPAMLVGCGSFQLGKDVSLTLDTDKQIAKVEIAMGDGLEVSLNGDFPVAGGKGRIYFVPATKTSTARIGFEANLLALAGSTMTDVGSISTLPSGANLPVAMTPPLLSVQVIKNQNFDVSAVFAVTPELQLGTVVGISQMNSKYIPTGGIAICQDFRNDAKVAFAAVCIYGPNGSRSGGIFVGANFGDVLHDVINNSSSVSTMALSAASAPFQMDAQLLTESKTVRSSDWVESSQGMDNLSARTKQKAANNIFNILKKR